jgi:hypothetical protein
LLFLSLVWNVSLNIHFFFSQKYMHQNVKALNKRGKTKKGKTSSNSLSSCLKYWQNSQNDSMQLKETSDDVRDIHRGAVRSSGPDCLLFAGWFGCWGGAFVLVDGWWLVAGGRHLAAVGTEAYILILCCGRRRSCDPL